MGKSVLRSGLLAVVFVCVGLPSGFSAHADEKPLAPGQLRNALRRLLQRPKSSLNPALQTAVEGEYRIDRGHFQSEALESVPFLACKPAGAQGRLPAVIVLHGTGGHKQRMLGVLKEFAKRGMLALAIDARYHGDRVTGAAHGSREYQEAILRAWRAQPGQRQEHPWYYDTVYDLWRTVDYLISRPDVDPKRIGMVGFSMGGIQTWLAAATDERIRVAVPAIGVQSFRWSLENERWQGRAGTISAVHQAVAADLGEPAVNARVCRALWQKVVPGILDSFDCPGMLRAIAPRPLLILNGEQDPNCPLAGAQLAFEAARTAYSAAHAPDRLQIDIAPGVAHQVTAAQYALMYAWFARWFGLTAPHMGAPAGADRRPVAGSLR